MNAYTMKNKKQAKNSIKKLSILIPAYNESKTIVGILEKIIRVDLPETIKKEIISSMIALPITQTRKWHR